MINTRPITINKDKSKIYGLRGFDLLKLRIKNWSKNRPHDHSRIPDIDKLLMDQDYVDGIVYLFKKDNGYFCYEEIGNTF